MLSAALIWASALLLTAVPRASPPAQTSPHGAERFQTSDTCVACHNGIVTGAGEDVSIGLAWRASMMANSSRDPYWQAAVRRETIDHPSAAEAIEDECSICHMPMARTQAHAAGRPGQVFAHLPFGGRNQAGARFAADGVSCAVCHQIGSEGLGTRASFTGGFTIPAVPAGRLPRMLGPFEIDAGRTSVMQSAAEATPEAAPHIQQSELCATCHTLFTETLDSRGKATGSLPEQVPYLEWRHSAFRDEQSCQACHMPAVDQPTPIASVLGEPRDGFSRHTFLGGNFFMLRMLDRHRRELAVEALSAELRAAADATGRQLRSQTATIAIQSATLADGALAVDVVVTNRTGHKLPTGYPSRRAWIHLTVRDAAGRPVFESGAIDDRGAIAGNDHDENPARFEPHHDEIRSGNDVQIYEATMIDDAGRPTTGLLRASAFVKDNRLLPRGFDKLSAGAEIAVRGEAAADATFVAAEDRVRYIVPIGGRGGPFAIAVELRYQPIAYRWARNLAAYDAPEPRCFVSYFEGMAHESSTVLAAATASVP